MNTVVLFCLIVDGSTSSVKVFLINSSLLFTSVDHLITSIQSLFYHNPSNWKRFE
jgi:hypothetical protein